MFTLSAAWQIASLIVRVPYGLKIMDTEVMIGSEGFTQQSGTARMKTQSLY